MNLLRFHLSTLLLLCIFAGATLGVALSRPVWDRKYTFNLPPKMNRDDDESALEFNRDCSRLFVFQSGEGALFDLSSGRAVWHLPFVYRKTSSSFEARFSEDQKTILLGQKQVVSGLKSKHTNDQLAYVVLCIFKTENGASTPANKFGPMRWELSTSPNHEFESPDGTETCLPEQEDANGNLHTCRRFLIYKCGNPTSNVPVYELPLPAPARSAVYSRDSRLLATSFDGGVIVWQRTRAYGPEGFLYNPIFWIAIGALVALVVVFARFLLRMRRRIVPNSN